MQRRSSGVCADEWNRLIFECPTQWYHSLASSSAATARSRSKSKLSTSRPKHNADPHSTRSKSADKKPQQWKPDDQPAGGDFAHNFSRPQRMSSRPGTSYSTYAPNTNWSAPYAGGAASSSMVELAGPTMRRPSVSSLRLGRNTRMFDAPPSPALPPALGGANGSRPGTPSRPGTAGKDWINPLDVHFGKDMTKQTAAPSQGSAPVSKSALGQFEFGIPGTDSKKAEDGLTQEKPTQDKPSQGKGSPEKSTHSLFPSKTTSQTPSPHGYPSPPLSINNGDGIFTPSTETRPSSSRRNAPSALRNVDTAAPTSPPSPTASDKREDSEHHETDSEADPEPEPEPAPAPAPVIRNVQAKRDTMWYHTPRRRSFTMAVEESELARRREERQKKELGEGGFAGNLAAFDFGETVRQPSVDTEMGTSPTETRKGPQADRNESPVLWKQTSVDSQKQNLDRTETPASQMYQASLDSAESPFGTRSRPAWDRADSPPKAKKSAPGEERLDAREQWVAETQKNIARAAASAPEQTRPATAIRSVDTPAPLSLSARRNAPPTEAPSRPPPRPYRPAPAPLSLSADRVESPARSPYGPPPEDGSYMRTDAAPAPAPPGQPGQRPPSSPYARPPIEGNFPVKKGLPRGRRPDKGELDPFDRSSPRRSAIPAPLSPRSPSNWTNSPTSLSPISSTAPRLPSPTFPSLEKSLSFELSAFDKDLVSPVLSEFAMGTPRSGSPGSVRRVDAKKAPPRPPPITLPPTANDGSKNAQQDFGMRSPVTEQAGFI